MAAATPAAATVEARILYWGIPGAGKTTNLLTIHAKLRSDNRGELRQIPTRVDPSVSFEVLPIHLGEVKGVSTRVQIIAVPSSPEQAPTRKQLLDKVDGIVIVIDSQGNRVNENIACFNELKQALAAYGRSLSDLPLVLQYNKHDLADLYALEELQRNFHIPGAAVFETVATEAAGPLRTLTTISKRVVRVLRDRGSAGSVPAAPQPANTPAPRPASGAAVVEEAILAEESQGVGGAALDAEIMEAQVALDASFQQAAQAAPARPSSTPSAGEIQILSVGAAKQMGPRALRIPLVIGRPQGDHATFSLNIQLDPLLDGSDE